MSTIAWSPIQSAPTDGRPLWVRGHNWGDPSKGQHYCWAFFDGSGWREAGCNGGELLHLFEFMESSDE